MKPLDTCLDALAQALRLASVPEHAQDDEWNEEYRRLIKLEGKMRAEVAQKLHKTKKKAGS